MSQNTAFRQEQEMRLSYGLAALNQGDRLVPWAFERRQLATS